MNEMHQELAHAIQQIHAKYGVQVSAIAVEWLEMQPRYIDELPSVVIGNIEVRSHSTINKVVAEKKP